MSSHTDIWITCYNREQPADLADNLNSWAMKQEHSAGFFALVPQVEDDEQQGLYMGDDVCAVTGTANHLDVDKLLKEVRSNFVYARSEQWDMYWLTTTVVLHNEYVDYPSVYRLTHEGEWI